MITVYPKSATSSTKRLTQGQFDTRRHTMAESNGRDISELLDLLEQSSTLSHIQGDSVLAATLW